MSSANVTEAIIALNAATNDVAAKVLALRNALAAGEPVTQNQLAQLDSIAARLEGLAADPQNPVPAT